MTIAPSRAPRRARTSSAGCDSPFALLAMALAAFAVSCAVLFGLAISDSASVRHVAIAMVAAMGALSWYLWRAHRRIAGRSEAANPTEATQSATPAAPAATLMVPAAAGQRLCELRTSACRREPPGGTAFHVRCFSMNCPCAHAADDEAPPPQAGQTGARAAPARAARPFRQK